MKDLQTWPPNNDEYRVYAIGTRTGEVYETGKGDVKAVSTFVSNKKLDLFLRRPTLVIVQHNDGAVTYFEGDRVEWTKLDRLDSPVPERAPITFVRTAEG